MHMANKHSDDIHGGGKSSPSVGFTPDALPEVQKPFLTENSQTGVSTRTVPIGTEIFAGKPRIAKFRHWYALRATYGREKKAYEYLISKNVVAFHPTLTTMKVVNGRRMLVEESRLPNIFFAYGTEDEIKAFVYDNVNLSFLRFYYRKVFVDKKIRQEPLIVPDHQMESFKIICASEAADIIVASSDIPQFKTGQMVRVIDGVFKGVIGKVARYQGQQRVAIIIDGLLTIASAYVPNAFLEPVT